MTEIENRGAPPRPLPPLVFSLLSMLIGGVAGLGAVAFRSLIALFHNLLFLGQLSAAYDANVHTPVSPWGPFVVLVPVAGAVGVAFLVKTFAPEAKGHGVPEVIDAIYFNRGRIRPAVAGIKSLASALSIGSGGSVGREGPIIQIGASFGSTVGQVLRVPAWQGIVLVVAGASSGIAATFNTPVGGVLFALEVMMHEVSARTLVPVAIATATATYVGRLFFGPHPSFIIPAFETPYFHVTDPLLLLAYVGLGLIMGVMSAVFIKSLYGVQDFFENRIGGSYYRQHVTGMLLVGLLMYLMLRGFGHYYIEGVGYATVQDVLTGSGLPLALLFLLCGLKLIATAVTLGSGASGGIFSPALYMGATLGAAYGTLLARAYPQLGVSAPAFGVAGMAGMVGGVTGAAMAAIVMIFEMTLDYNVIIPMTVVVAVSYGLRTVLSKESIYSAKLNRRGHFTPEGLHANPHFVRRASEFMNPRLGVVRISSTVDECAKTLSDSNDPAWCCVLVAGADAKTLLGILTADAVLRALSDTDHADRLDAFVSQDYVIVSETDSLFSILNTMHAHDARVALVADHARPVMVDNVKGVITKDHLANAMAEAAELFSD